MAEVYTGEVKNGVIVLDEGTPPLPEGMAVRVVLDESPPKESGAKTIAERYAGIVGIAEGLPPDLANEHDHYIHGTPRRETP